VGLRKFAATSAPISKTNMEIDNMTNIAQKIEASTGENGSMSSFESSLKAENALYNIKALISLAHRDEIESPRIEDIKTVNQMILKELEAIAACIGADLSYQSPLH